MHTNERKGKSGIMYDLQCYITYTNLFTNIYSFYVFLCLFFSLYLFCVVRIKSCILIYSKADTELPSRSLEHINTKPMFHCIKF